MEHEYFELRGVRCCRFCHCAQFFSYLFFFFCPSFYARYETEVLATYIDEKAISVKIQLSCLKYYLINLICWTEISAGKLLIDKSEVSCMKRERAWNDLNLRPDKLWAQANRSGGCFRSLLNSRARRAHKLHNSYRVLAIKRRE